jgi:hypothetical protein
VVVTATPVPTPEPQVLFQDSFEDEDSGWSLGETSDEAIFYDNGQLHFLAKTPGRIVWSSHPELEAMDDFNLEVDVTQVSGSDDNQFGVIFQYQDIDNWCAFLISGDGYFKLRRRYQGEDFDFTQWTPVASIRQGRRTNHLQLEVRRSRISVFINNELIAIVPNSTFQRGGISLSAGAPNEPDVHVAFDNLRVKTVIIPTPTPTPTRTPAPTPTRTPAPTPTFTARLPIPRVINEILDSVESEGLSEPLVGDYSELIEEFENYLSEDPENLWVQLNLAHMYHQSLQYRKAFVLYLIASEQAPGLADPLIGLGRLYYDLAIIDMVSRGLTSFSDSGLLVFHPDERAKEVLRLAKEQLLAAKRLPRLELVDEDGAKVYVSPPGTEDQFLEMIEQHLGEH